MLRDRKIAIVSAVVASLVLLGYASNTVSRSVLIDRMGVDYMGGAWGRNQSLTRQFADAAISRILLPFHVRVSVQLSLGGRPYSEVRSGIYLFGFAVYEAERVRRIG